MIDVKRLKHDRDYWDSVAVEGATHFYPNGWSVNWYRQDGAGLYCWRPNCEEWAKIHHHTYTVGKFIPRPAPKQWSGPEDGLPPVGSKVEGYINYGASSRWREVEVLKHNNEEAAVFCANGGCGFLAWCTEFRPLKSEKERVVEYWIGRLPWPGKAESDSFVLSALYDMGALKMPEEDQ